MTTTTTTTTKRVIEKKNIKENNNNNILRYVGMRGELTLQRISQIRVPTYKFTREIERETVFTFGFSRYLFGCWNFLISLVIARQYSFDFSVIHLCSRVERKVPGHRHSTDDKIKTPKNFLFFLFFRFFQIGSTVKKSTFCRIENQQTNHQQQAINNKIEQTNKWTSWN